MRKIAQVVGIGVSLLILARALWIWSRQERTRIRVLQRSRNPRQPEELHQFGAHNGLGGLLGSANRADGSGIAIATRSRPLLILI